MRSVCCLLVCFYLVAFYFTLCLLGMSITPYLYFKGDFAWYTIILSLKQYDHSIKTATRATEFARKRLFGLCSQALRLFSSI